MIPTSKIGYEFKPIIGAVSEWQLKLFAKATGEDNPIFLDEDVALAAGHRALPAPPTFAFSMGLASPRPFAKYADLGIDMNKMLHANQEFDFKGLIYAGDTITTKERVKDLFDKKDGALEFVVLESTSTNQGEELLCVATSTLVIRH